MVKGIRERVEQWHRDREKERDTKIDKQTEKERDTKIDKQTKREIYRKREKSTVISYLDKLVFSPWWLGEFQSIVLLTHWVVTTLLWLGWRFKRKRNVWTIKKWHLDHLERKILHVSEEEPLHISKFVGSNIFMIWNTHITTLQTNQLINQSTVYLRYFHKVTIKANEHVFIQQSNEHVYKIYHQQCKKNVMYYNLYNVKKEKKKKTYDGFVRQSFHFVFPPFHKDCC